MSGIDADPAPVSASKGRIGIIAGGGALPLAVVRTLVAQGANPFVAVIDGEVENAAAFAIADYKIMQLEDFGLLIPQLKKAGVARLIMAGGVARRPRLRAIRWTLSTLKLIPRVAAAITRGDDGVLRAVVEIMETNGITVVGAHEIVPNLLAPQGQLSRQRPTETDWRDIMAASEAAIAIGQLDIGQAAISIGGRVVALEGIEGTDGLLERMVALRGHGRLAGKQRGVLVKRCKPQQELRTDLPAIGPDTMDQAQAAGLAGVAMDAGRSFILEYERTIARADELGLFVIGLEPAKVDK